ncbi:serine/threonine-protein kinase EDR1 [Canna indica]|uniref:non-specific serine/threonine protein kinase n=1 Tax=Canna indica TaxID=4628 RepID=A0AAQ3Q6I8_9LILI|nr:serine/threonine-protein kinase EDR1 [Canna indica]
MKNIFRIKRHAHRSNDVQSLSPTPGAASEASLTPSSSAAAAPPTFSEADNHSKAEAEAASVSNKRTEYISSEEEFQVQLALALSVSNSDFRADCDGDQIRAAKILSMGNHSIALQEDGSPDSLSRRYWDYGVLDYDEKVVDGFYDIFGLSDNSTNQAKMPSISDLQTSNGGLGFEAIIVNRAIDPALVELEQVAQCILLDHLVFKTGLLVQKLSELVMEHMGGPVKDANDMLMRWMEKTTELRITQQTCLIPLGCIRVGLSRHRALLFKVLADTFSIPCRLVKGSHYTGIDDDAVNIIKLDNDREFLVDLMAAPGTLIPADILSLKDASLNSSNPRVNLPSSTTNNPEDNLIRVEALCDVHIGGNGASLGDNGEMDKRSKYENVISFPSGLTSDFCASSENIGNSFSANSGNFTQQPSEFMTSTMAASSKQRETIATPMADDNIREEKLDTVLSSQDRQQNMENPIGSRELFAELNPFHLIGVRKPAVVVEPINNRNSAYHRHTENTTTPLVWKGRSAYNEPQNTKQNNFIEELFPRKNIGPNGSSLQMQSPIWEVHSNKLCDTSGHTPTSSEDNKKGIILDKNQLCRLDTHCLNDSAAMSISSLKPSSPVSKVKNAGDMHQDGVSLQSSKTNESMELGQNVNGKHPSKYLDDGFLEINTNSKNSETSYSLSQTKPISLGPMLEDVTECEIPWEDLVIGERIGLGSYGEVYLADWNGTEVAVKKFLDQDFYGDALDEFRSEVQIMRRLRHPNVVQFLGAVTRPPNLSIVSEFLPRGSLYQILHHPNCQIDEKHRIKMALDVAKGMNCLHTSVPTVVHRDLKSPNLLVDNNWTVKVCDFGLSRLKHSTFLSSKSTGGTPEWMAPEVLRNEPSNEKCDVYSFGVILWELATLRIPWSGINPMQVVGAVGFQDRHLDIPKEVDPLVARIIRECWQK